MKKIVLIFLVLVFASLIINVWFFPQLPDKIASHWNIRGEVDGYSSKFLGLFLMPLILIITGLLFIIIPKIDPLKENIGKFKKYYDTFTVLMFVFIFLLHLQIVLWNLNIKITPNSTLPVGIGLLFFYVGVLCKNSKRNWFIGIRTPWTLSNEVVWDKTHQLGGWLFKISGFISLTGIIFHNWTIFFIVVPVFLTAVTTFIYSYFEYKKQIKV